MYLKCIFDNKVFCFLTNFLNKHIEQFFIGYYLVFVKWSYFESLAKNNERSFKIKQNFVWHRNHSLKKSSFAPSLK